MALLFIPLLPLLSFTLLILIGRRLGKWSAAVSLLALAGSLFLSVRAFFNWMAVDVPLRVSWIWLTHMAKPLKMGLLIDSLSATMCLVVTIVGWLIMLYSIG